MFEKRKVRMSVSVLCASVFVCVSVFVAVAGATAQVPQKINYQLRITDLAGEPLMGPHVVTYRIFDAATDGTQLWEETQNETANDNGVVSTILGTVNPIDILFDSPCWLEVVVDGETLDPRRELVSSPYAFHATNTDNLGGSPPGAYSLDGHEHDAAYVNEGQADAITSAMIQDDAVGQDDVYRGYVDLTTSGQDINVSKDFNATVYADQFYVSNAGNASAVYGHNAATSLPTIWGENNSVGIGVYGVSASGNAFKASNTSSIYPAVYTENLSSSDPGSYITGIYSYVKSADFTGIGTNGEGYFGGGTFASVESTRGPVVMTSPLVREIEIYISGSGRLAGGQARIDLDSDMVDAIAKSEAMKVIVTPTDMCNGMAVTKKDWEGFTVRELASGSSDATFDWLVIARRAASPGSRAAATMPAEVPRAVACEARLAPAGEE